MSLVWEKLEFSFTKGLNQKGDARTGIQAPELVRAVDVEFDETGGLRHRKPYDALATDLLSGGQISAVKRIYGLGDELMGFSSTELISYSPQRAGWASRGTHLAVKTDEEARFITTGNQVQCDRAELDNCVVTVWTDLAAGSSVTGTVYYAITDKTTGTVTVAPTAVSGAITRPRVVATTTKILLFYVTTTPTLLVRSIDPLDGALSGATTVLGANVGGRYDVVKQSGADAVVFALHRNPTTSYEVGIVTAGLVVTQATKARVCDGAIAIASDSGGTLQVIRGNGTAVEGDRLSAALADQAVNQAIGTITSGTVNQIAACHRADARCYVFWEDYPAAAEVNVKYNYVTTAGALGTEAIFLRHAVVASRAFTYSSSVYVNLQFLDTASFASASSLFDAIASQVQNTYYLYRDDGFLSSKALPNRAGGTSDTIGYLPGVALTSGSTAFSWCATERRIVPIGTVFGGLGYSDRGPRDVTFTFDSNEARRCARFGQTIYIACGEGVLQYDGLQITEVGYHYAPYQAVATETAAGSIAANGQYAYRFSYRWDNAKGERDRSTTGTAGSAPIAAAAGGFDLTTMVPLNITHKSNRPVAMEVWRTALDPTDEAPFYLVTSQDPTVTTGSNCYIANDTTLAAFASWNDAMADTTLTGKETNPENGAELENLPAPSCSLIVANDTRLFIAGIAGDPNRVWYSKQRQEGHVAAFHDALTVAIPEAGGDITGLAFLNETLIVFRETAIYALSGDGFDNVGGGSNYQPRLISSDCGAVNQESIVLAPMGLVFKSSKGWYVLNRGWATDYIGAAVCDYDSETVYAAHVVESQHQVRIQTSGRMLVWDYLVNAWAEWTVTGIHAAMYGGAHHSLASSGQSVRAQSSSYATADYGMDVEMLLHLGGVQHFSRVRKILALGEYRSTHTLRFRIGKYAESTYFDDSTWTPSPTTVGGELQVQHGPSQQQHQAIRVRLTASTTAGEKLKLSALSLEVGMKQGMGRTLPAAQRQ